MAEIWTDFSEYTTGVAPSDWTDLWASSATWTVEDVVGAEGGKVLRVISPAISDRKAFVWDLAQSTLSGADIEVVAKIRRITTGQPEFRFVFRASGNDGSETAYTVGRGSNNTDDQFRHGQYVSGAFTDIASVAATATTVDAWYWVRVHVHGTTIRSKSWADGNTEPSTWDLETLNQSDITAAGATGYFHYGDYSADHEISVIGMADGGATAPMTDPAGGDTTAPTLSSPTASADGGDGYSGTVDTDEGNGTLYHVVTQSATAPSKAQVKAGQDDTGSAADADNSQSISSSGTKNVGQTGVLAAGTAYYVHYMHEDAAGNQSDVASSTSFTTTALTVTETVEDKNGNLIANESSITWSFFDDLQLAPVNNGTGKTTDASGVIEVYTPNSDGTQGYLVIELADGRVAISKATPA